MPYRVVHCRVCGAAIGGENFPQRMAKLRRHYKARHPRKWKESVRKGVEARRKSTSHG